MLRGKVCLKMCSSSSKPKWRQLYIFLIGLNYVSFFFLFLFLPRELRWPSRHPVLNQPPFIALRSQTILLWDLNFASTCLKDEDELLSQLFPLLIPWKTCLPTRLLWLRLNAGVSSRCDRKTQKQDSWSPQNTEKTSSARSSALNQITPLCGSLRLHTGASSWTFGFLLWHVSFRHIFTSSELSAPAIVKQVSCWILPCKSQCHWPRAGHVSCLSVWSKSKNCCDLTQQRCLNVCAFPAWKLVHAYLKIRSSTCSPARWSRYYFALVWELFCCFVFQVCYVPSSFACANLSIFCTYIESERLENPSQSRQSCFSADLLRSAPRTAPGPATLCRMGCFRSSLVLNIGLFPFIIQNW